MSGPMKQAAADLTPAPELQSRLAEYARAPHLLVALDFDGVLAPLVDDPTQSRPTPAAAEAMERLAGAAGVQLALVSGRPAADLGELATPPTGTWLVGSHGAQEAHVGTDGSVHVLPIELDDDERALLHRLTEALEKIAAEPEFDGAWVEHKPAAVALHTRLVSDPQAAERALAFALAGPGSWPGTYAQPGKQVVEIPVVQHTKGAAVAALRHRMREQLDAGSASSAGGTSSTRVAVFFAGDDITDETVLATLGEGDLGVKVGDGDSVASVRVADEEAIATLLHQLADLRT